MKKRYLLLWVYYALVLSSFIYTHQCHGQVFFKKWECQSSSKILKYRIGLLSQEKNQQVLCKIGGSVLSIEAFSKEEQLMMIEELLTYEGDTSASAYHVQCYELMLCEPRNLSNVGYSIQVEALFLINQIYFDNPFFYASVPILVNRDTGAIHNFQSKEIAEIYKHYKNWYQRVLSMGLRKARRKKVLPIPYSSKVQWGYQSYPMEAFK